MLYLREISEQAPLTVHELRAIDDRMSHINLILDQDDLLDFEIDELLSEIHAYNEYLKNSIEITKKLERPQIYLVK